MSLSYHSVMYFVFVLHLLLLITAANNLPPYTPTDLILLNCGASSSSVAPDGRKWDTDARSKFQASKSPTSSSAFTASEQDPSVPAVPYMTARIFRSTFTYSFPLSPGPKFVRLYFYGASYSNLHISHSFFSLKANAYTLLSNFSAFLTVSAIHPSVAYLLKEFVITVQENQMLNITFNPSPKSFAFINGIEIVSMPNGLYAKDSDTPLTFVGSDTFFYLDSSTAFETVYRLNVGGGYIDGINDSGMYRTWLQDSDFIFGPLVGVVSIASGTMIRYARNTPAFVAPALVYSTMRSMGSNLHLNLNYNLTWILSVDSGFNYLVRLHFCETRKGLIQVNDVVFLIFINNQTAEDQADIIYWSGGNSSPVYKDYIVWIPKGNHNKQDLWLALHPNMKTKPVAPDAFLNGLEIFKLNNSDGSLAGSNPELTAVPPSLQQQPISPENETSKGPLRVLIVIGAIFAGILGLSSIICLFLLQRKWKQKDKSCRAPFSSITSTSATSLPTHRCHRFTILAIRAATKNFEEKNVIGSGGFGTVYKGYIEDGPIRPVAIKRLDSSSKQGTNEFKTEIEMLSQLRHANLVSLIGYCIDEGENILVYDYMTNGTLRQHLYDTNNDPIPWKKRLQMCIGAARGLHYLHYELKHTIIHRDVKTPNILLDEKWIAKVSDFGLAKEAFSEEVSTIVKGTWGYLDPEYARYKQLTQKSDVYSFGVVLFEVLCARKPVNQKLEEEQINLVNWAKKCIQNGTFYELIDPCLRGRIAAVCLRKFVMIALSCVHDKGIDRPTMYDVKGELEFALELQEAADIENQVIDPDGKYLYPEPEVSFFASQMYTDIEPQFESISASVSPTFATTTTSLQTQINRLVDCI